MSAWIMSLWLCVTNVRKGFRFSSLIPDMRGAKWWELSLLSSVVVVIPALGFVTSPGCQMEQQIERIGEGSQAVMMKVIDKAKLDQSNLTAGGQVTNPEYQFEFVAGTGVYAKGVVRVIGVSGDVRVMGGGSGQAEPDQDLRDKIYAIMQRDDIGEEVRKQLVADAVAKWIASQPTTQPE